MDRVKATGAFHSWQRGSNAWLASHQAIDASIVAKAEFEYLYDKPCEDHKKVRDKVGVAGSFTVESLSPHRVLGVDENDELTDLNGPRVAEQQAEYNAARDFTEIIQENLETVSVQPVHAETGLCSPRWCRGRAAFFVPDSAAGRVGEGETSGTGFRLLY